MRTDLTCSRHAATQDVHGMWSSVCAEDVRAGLVRVVGSGEQLNRSRHPEYGPLSCAVFRDLTPSSQCLNPAILIYSQSPPPIVEQWTDS